MLWILFEKYFLLTLKLKTAMQRDYVILNQTERHPVIVSIHSQEYCDLLMAGYSVMYEGNKKSCLKILEGEMELAA